MRASVLAAVAIVLLGVALFLTMKRHGSVEPKVKEYVRQLPTVKSAPEAMPLRKYYARKDTLKVSGNIIVGNWVLGNASAGCTAPGSSTLLLSDIKDIDDIVPCPAGSTLVAATMK